jgi:hypothetical protein
MVLQQKNRGKRPLPDEPPPISPTATTEEEGQPTKRSKPDKPLSVFLFYIHRSCSFNLSMYALTAEYEIQVKNYAGHSLKDNGIGVRPLVK